MCNEVELFFCIATTVVTTLSITTTMRLSKHLRTINANPNTLITLYFMFIISMLPAVAMLIGINIKSELLTIGSFAALAPVIIVGVSLRDKLLALRAC